MKAAIIAIIAVVLVGGAGWYVYDKNHNKTPATTSTTSQSSTSSQTPTTTASGDIVTTKSGSDGPYLADSKGMPLYTYGPDKPGVSNCSGSCISNWPIYEAVNAPVTLPTNVTVITRSDGKKQYAYKDMPLYYFSSDSRNGSPTGDGVAAFHLAKP